jgi:hypothetical protein
MTFAIKKSDNDVRGWGGVMNKLETRNEEPEGTKKKSKTHPELITLELLSFEFREQGRASAIAVRITSGDGIGALERRLAAGRRSTQTRRSRRG